MTTSRRFCNFWKTPASSQQALLKGAKLDQYILFYCLFSISSNMAKQTNTSIHTKYPKGTGKEREVAQSLNSGCSFDKATEAWCVCPMHFFKWETSSLSPAEWKWPAPMETEHSHHHLWISRNSGTGQCSRVLPSRMQPALLHPCTGKPQTLRALGCTFQHSA